MFPLTQIAFVTFDLLHQIGLLFPFHYYLFGVTFFILKKINFSTNNTDNTEKIKIIVLKGKINAKAKQTQFLNYYISDEGFKKSLKE